MVDINRKTYERNGIETIMDNDQILWLNKKYIEEVLDHKSLEEFTIKYHSDHRKKLAIKVIMDCRTRLGFNQQDVILTKEQAMLIKIMTSFEGENMQTQYNVFSYRIDLYFLDYKLATEIDENGYSDRIID